MLGRVGGALAVVSLYSLVGHGQAAAPDTLIPPGASVFVAYLSRGFDQDLTVAIVGARIPVVLVKDRRAADFEITGRQERKQSDGLRREWVQEASLSVADAKTGAVVDAFTVTKADTKSLAAACASRFGEKVGVARSPELALLPPRPAPPPPDGSSIRLFIQGDVKHLSDFAQVFRAELRRLGVEIDVVEPGTAYDYNIVTAQDSDYAAALALDTNGLVVASAVSHGFSAGGSVGNAARDLAKRLAATVRGAR
jgi:hypothetical protein